MGLNKPFDRNFFLSGGAVKTTGGASALAKGQLAVVDQSTSVDDGAKVMSTFAGKPKNKKDLAIRVGITDIGFNKTRSNKSASTSPFSLEMIKSLTASAPKSAVQKVDEVVIGYDGFNPATSFSFKIGDPPLKLALELKDGGLPFRGGAGECELLVFDFEIPSIDPFDSCEDIDPCSPVDCKAITLDAIERIRRRQLVGGLTVNDYVEVTPVFGGCTDSARTEIPYVYYTLSVCDTGTDEALALVQVQYNVPVIRINRKGSTSIYQVLLPDPQTPADYAQTVTSIIKGCETCPAGYSEVVGGYVYAITVEDDGVDKTTVASTIQSQLASAKYVANTIIKSGNNAGVGFYTAVYTSPITQAEIDAYIAQTTNNNMNKTATVQLISDTTSFCEDDTVTTTPWVEGETCNAVQDRYSIVLPDDTCGENRLTELQTAYNGLTVYGYNSTRALTLTSALSSGTANINVGGVNYLATYATSLTVTATNFVTAHAAAILAATGVVVTSTGAVLNFAGPTFYLNTITILNVTTDLAGTLAAIAVDFTGAGCQNKYEVLVLSNLVCDECDPVFLDFYVTEAPAKYDATEWTLESSVVTTGTCLCGIRFKGREFRLSGDEALRNQVGFTESSTQIQVSAGFPSEIREGIGTLPTGTYKARYFSRFEKRTHLGGNLIKLEEEGRAYFLGESYRHDYLGRVFTGETSVIEDSFAQYVDYALEVNHSAYSNSVGQIGHANVVYHFFVELGKHKPLETLLNNLAAAAGVVGVQI